MTSTIIGHSSPVQRIVCHLGRIPDTLKVTMGGEDDVLRIARKLEKLIANNTSVSAEQLS